MDHNMAFARQENDISHSNNPQARNNTQDTLTQPRNSKFQTLNINLPNINHKRQVGEAHSDIVEMPQFKRQRLQREQQLQQRQPDYAFSTGDGNTEMINFFRISSIRGNGE